MLETFSKNGIYSEIKINVLCEIEAKDYTSFCSKLLQKYFSLVPETNINIEEKVNAKEM